MSQSAVTGMTPREAQPANLGPAAALISRWLFFFPSDEVYLPPMMVTRCEMVTLTSSGYEDTVTLQGYLAHWDLAPANQDAGNESAIESPPAKLWCRPVMQAGVPNVLLCHVGKLHAAPDICAMSRCAVAAHRPTSKVSWEGSSTLLHVGKT